MASDELLQCPYDPNHWIRPKRFPYHVVKCRENNVHAARVTGACPYNARHLYPRGELPAHILECPDRCISETFEAITVNPTVPPQASASNWQSPPCEEDWENDTDTATTPFVLDQGGLSFIGDELRKQIEQEQREDLRSPRAYTSNPQAYTSCEAESSDWGDDTPLVRSKTGKGAGVTNLFQNAQRNEVKQPSCVIGSAVTESSAKSSPGGSEDLTPKKVTRNNRQRPRSAEDVLCHPVPHFQQKTPEKPPHQKGQRPTGNDPNEGTSQTYPVWSTLDDGIGDFPYAPPRQATIDDLSSQTGECVVRRKQKPNAATGHSSSSWGKKPNPWQSGMGDSPSHPPPRQDTSGNLSSQTGQSAARMEQKPNVTGQSSSAWGRKPNPWQIDMGNSPSPPPRQGASKNLSSQTGQSAARMEQKPNAVTGQSSSAWGQKPNPWKTNIGHSPSPPPKQAASENLSSPAGQSALRRKQKPNDVIGESSTAWGQKLSPWKTDMGHSPSPPPRQATNENLFSQIDQSAAKMEQKPNAVTGQISSPWGQKPNPWKTGVKSFPAPDCNKEKTEDFPPLIDRRSSRMEQNLERQMPAFNQNFNFWKDGLEVVVSPPSPQFADTNTSGQGQMEKRALDEGPKPYNRGGRGGVTWGAPSGPWKNSSFQEKRK